MGLFDLFGKKAKPVQNTQVEKTKAKIPESEKKYYQQDDYYTDVVFAGTPFEQAVITFEERKKTAIPSKRGLYPAEILLLEYCSMGNYPGPKNGYPGFWWFSYGIRNVGAALKNLENRGYIQFAPVKDSLSKLTILQLKELLSSAGYSTEGKKAELVMRVSENVPDIVLIEKGVQPKYQLTEIGRQELADNAYVPYMHKASNKTTENDTFGITFNVWSINKLLGNGDKSNWKDVVDAQERKMYKETSDRNDAFRKRLKQNNPEQYEAVTAQDQQLVAVQEAREKYNADGDLDTYINFWEKLWKDGGLKFEGSRWHFELPDLYIKAKRYDDALAFLTKLKRTKPSYADKADGYIKRIEESKRKLAAKKTKSKLSSDQ